jgi:hypothetical protein
MTQKLKKPPLDGKNRKEIERALDEIEEMDVSNPAASEVALDNLASLLRKLFFADQRQYLTRRTPSLYDLVEKMHKVYDLEESILDAAYELKTALEDSYIETNEMTQEKAQSSRGVVVQGIKNFL